MKPIHRQQSHSPCSRGDKPASCHSNSTGAATEPVAGSNLCQSTTERYMNTGSDYQRSGDNASDSPGEVAACLDSSPPKSRTAELLKAMYYFVLSGR